MTTFTFAPAKREQAKARIALAGPSGAGKTFTALRLGTAMGDRVAVIDTEHGSASKYAKGADGVGFDFDALNLTNFDPRNLIGALAAAAQARYDVVIIDSLSHFWSGVGGMLEQADNFARKYGGNSFAGWKDARPLERQLIEAMLAFPGHVIVTMRSKTEYVIEENERGRKTPRKVGMKPEQRDGIEYEFDVVGDLDVENTLIITKTRCSALTGAVIRQPGEELARTISEWLSGGAPAPDATVYIDRATAEGLTVADALELYKELEQRQLLGAPMLHPQTGAPTSVGSYVMERGKALRAGADQPAAAPQSAPQEEPQQRQPVRSRRADPGPWDTGAPQRPRAVPAEPASPEDEHQGAITEYLKVADKAGIAQADARREFETSYGLPLDEAATASVREFTEAIRKGAAA